MKVLKFTALVVAVTGMAAVTPSAQDRSTERRSRELTMLAGREAELGVRISDVTSGGVKVEGVDAGSAAEKAGLKNGDVILEFDGEHVRSARQLARLVRETPPGRTVKATISRDGRKQDVQITTDEGRETATIFGAEPFRGTFRTLPRGDRLDLDRLRDLPFDFNFDFNLPSLMSGSRLGVTVDDLTPQLADYFGVKDGVLVRSVADGSAAAQAGLKAGDVITSVNGSRVQSREDLLHAVRQSENDELTIVLVRDKREMTVKAKIEAPRRPRGGRAI
jgi:serine protease Do